MKISCTQLGIPIELSVYNPFVLYVENPNEYYRIVNQFLLAFDGNVSDFTFWDGEEQIHVDKIGGILTDLMTFSFHDRKIISLLHKQLQKNFSEGLLLPYFQEVSTEIEKFILELCSTVNFQTENDDVSIESLLKICAVRPAINYESLLEKIICYLNILKDLRGATVVVFVGLKNVLSDKDLKLLYNHCALHKISLLIIESVKSRPLLSEEKAIIITDDLCEIVENF